jgi:hypothetical protein
MMSEPIVSVDTSEVLYGKLDELKQVMTDLVAMVESREPDLLSCAVYFDEEEERMTMMHIHRDTAALVLHMKVVDEARSLENMVRVVAIDIYGAPNDELVERLQEKARMFKNVRIHVHTRHAGFARFPM